MYLYNVKMLGDDWTLCFGLSHELFAAGQEALGRKEDVDAVVPNLSEGNVVCITSKAMILLPLQANTDQTVEALRLTFAELMSAAVFLHNEDKADIFYRAFKSHGRALHMVRTICNALVEDLDLDSRPSMGLEFKVRIVRIGDSSPNRHFSSLAVAIGGEV